MSRYRTSSAFKNLVSSINRVNFPDLKIVHFSTTEFALACSLFIVSSSALHVRDGRQSRSSRLEIPLARDRSGNACPDSTSKPECQATVFVLWAGRCSGNTGNPRYNHGSCCNPGV